MEAKNFYQYQQHLKKRLKIFWEKTTTYQFSITRTWGTSYNGIIGCNHPTFVITSDGPNHPSWQIMNWLRVHVSLFIAHILSPHVNGSRHFAYGQIELTSSYYFPNSTLGSIQKFDQSWNHFITGFWMAKSAITSKSPWKGSVTIINDDCVVLATTDVLDNDVSNWSDGFAFGIFFNKQSNFQWCFDQIETFFSCLFDVLSVSIVSAEKWGWRQLHTLHMHKLKQVLR